jgi:hypothetical protein
MNSVIDMSAVQERREVATVSEDAAILQVIARAARDPNIDIDKMERLLQMQERIVERQAKTAYADALSRLQPTLPIIGERGAIKNNSGAVQSKYALWEDIVGIVTPLLAAQGFSLSFRTGNKDGKIQVTGVLTHREGHSEETTLDLPADTSGSKNAVQAVASSVSYGKRYTAGALLNLRTGELDDDGKTAGEKDYPRITEQQEADLKALITEHGGDMSKLLRYLKVSSLAEIHANNYEWTVAEVRRLAKVATEARSK